MKFIFEVKLKPGATEEQYVQAWQKGSEIIQRQPGARGTELHRKIGEDGVLLAIASWESVEAREQAMSALKNVDDKTRQILDKHKEYGEITIIGAFEDSQWQVKPA